MIATIGHGWVGPVTLPGGEKRWQCPRCNATRRQRVGVNSTEQRADGERSWHMSVPCKLRAPLAVAPRAA